MRHKIAGRLVGKVAAVAAVLSVAFGAAPAMACYTPCAQGGLFSFGADYGYDGYAAYGASRREQLPDPTRATYYNGPQYYYVNQGPLYSGAGNIAPAPTYQERAVSGWHSYDRPYYYGYNGGPYANTTSHYYDGARLQGPAIYTYRARRARYHRTHSRGQNRIQRPATRYYYTARPGARYASGVRPGPRYGAANRNVHSRAYDAPRAHGQRHGVNAQRVVQRNGATHGRLQNRANPPHWMQRQ